MQVQERHAGASVTDGDVMQAQLLVVPRFGQYYGRPVMWSASKIAEMMSFADISEADTHWDRCILVDELVNQREYRNETLRPAFRDYAHIGRWCNINMLHADNPVTEQIVQTNASQLITISAYTRDFFRNNRSRVPDPWYIILQNFFTDEDLKGWNHASHAPLSERLDAGEIVVSQPGPSSIGKIRILLPVQTPGNITLSFQATDFTIPHAC